MEQNQDKVQGKSKKKGKLIVLISIGAVVGALLSMIVMVAIINTLFPNVVRYVCNSLEMAINDLTGVVVDFNGDGIGPSSDKPVIYVYGAEDGQEVKVRLDASDEMLCEYPKRDEDGYWRVKADKDGRLIIDEEEYNYIFWESRYKDVSLDFSKGYCIKGSDSREFLENKLEEIGLNRKEANEFIVYWLPRLEKNEYNLISFQDELYKEHYKLSIEPETKNTLRVYMTFKGIESAVKIEEQDLSKIKGDFKRDGLYIVEWGGSEIK